MKKLEYSLKNLSLLPTFDLIISESVPDNQMIFMERADTLRDGAFAPHKFSIWNLDTGEIRGNADPTYSRELYMSSKRCAQLIHEVEKTEDEGMKGRLWG